MGEGPEAREEAPPVQLRAVCHSETPTQCPVLPAPGRLESQPLSFQPVLVARIPCQIGRKLYFFYVNELMETNSRTIPDPQGQPWDL